MQNSSMLQARYRYLQARRDLEYKLLKEIDAQKEAEARKEAMIVRPDGFHCATCKKEFITKAGLASHQRAKTCEEK